MDRRQYVVGLVRSQNDEFGEALQRKMDEFARIQNSVIHDGTVMDAPHVEFADVCKLIQHDPKKLRDWMNE